MIEADHKRFVGQNLALARTALGATQADWTRDYNLGSPSKISQWEKGTNYPNPWILRRLCEDYGLTMDWFYRGVRAGVSADLAANLRRVEQESAAA